MEFNRKVVEQAEGLIEFAFGLAFAAVMILSVLAIAGNAGIQLAVKVIEYLQHGF